MKTHTSLILFCIFCHFLAQGQITRSQIIANAEPFESLQWTATLANKWNNVSCGSKNIISPTWIAVGSNRSMPYCWGGNSSITGFQNGLAGNKSAGDICASSCGYSFGAEPNCSVGVDCSGFVCRAWGRTDHVSTSSLHTISTQLASVYDMQVGDIVNLAGSHTRLVHQVNTNGTWEMIESSGAYDKVHYYAYSASALSSYTPRYYNSVSGGGGSSQLLTGSQTCSGAVTINSATTCSWTNGTVNNATASGYPKGACDNVTSPSLNDVWYKFVAQGNNTTITVDPTSSGSTALDPIIMLYSSCSAGAEMACIDQTGGAGGTTALTRPNLVVGNTYYIRLYDYGTVNATAGDYRICVTHIPPPLPDLTVQSLTTDPTSITVGQSVDLCATIANIGQGDATSTITWNYTINGSTIDNDTHTSLTAGDTRSECETNYVFNSVGSYQYCVVIQNHSQETNTSNNSSCITVNVSNAPCNISANISGNTSTCAGGNVNLSATASGCNNCQYQWSNGLGSGANKSVTPSQTTTYTLTVTESGTTCTATATHTITVNQTPNVSISPPNPTVCQGGSTTLTASGANSYSWSNGSTGSTVNVSTAGAYSVTGTSNGCTASASATVSQSNSLNISISAMPTAICTGGSATLTASGANSYSWSNGSTGSTVNVNTAGTYSVTGTNSSGCTGTASVTITSATGPNVTVLANPATIQPGGSSTLTVNPTNAAIYAWSNGAGSGSTATVSPTSTTAYTVTVTDANGCTGTGTVVVTVTNCAFTLTPPTTLNFTSTGGNTSAQLQATGPAPCNWSGNTCSWVTLSPDNGTGSQSITIAVAANTDTASRSCTVTIAGQNFTVTQAGTTVNGCTLPKPSITSPDNRRLAASTHQNVSYQWFESGFPVTNATSQYYNTVGASGCYTVKITENTNINCFSESDPYCIVGINDLSAPSIAIKAYPNPSTGKFTLSFIGTTPNETFRMHIWNMLGQLISTQQYDARGNNQWQTEIDLARQPDGVYLLEVVTEEGRIVERLMKH